MKIKKYKSVISLISILAFAASMLLTSSAYGSGDKKHFELKGTVNGLNGAKLLLISVSPSREIDTIGQAVVKNGAFKISGKLESPALVYLNAPATKHTASFWLIPGKVKIELDTAKYSQNIRGIQTSLIPTVKGSKENDLYNAYVEKTKLLYSDLDKESKKLEGIKDPEEKKKLEIKLSDLREDLFVKSNKSTLEFISENPNSIVSAYLLSTVMNDYYTPVEKLQGVLNNFSGDVKKSGYYKENEKEFEKILKIQPGKPAPDFTLSDTTGKDLSLSQFKGKLVLIDFWASWCIPCVESIPSLKNIYALYKDKGFEILGVSDDSKQDAWKKSIRENTIPWTNVVDRFPVKFRPAEVGTLYSVHFIPATILIDKNGIIIAKNLHGKELEDKIKENL